MSTVVIEAGAWETSTWQTTRSRRRPHGFACQVGAAPLVEPAVLGQSEEQSVEIVPAEWRLSRVGGLVGTISFTLVVVAAAACLVWTVVASAAAGYVTSPLV